MIRSNNYADTGVLCASSGHPTSVSILYVIISAGRVDAKLNQIEEPTRARVTETEKPYGAFSGELSNLLWVV